MNHSRHQKFKNKQLNYTNKNNRVSKVKNSPLELKKNFKHISISIHDLNKLKQKVLRKKKMLAKNTWYV